MPNNLINPNECPLCDKPKRKSSDLVCPACYQIFVTDAGRSLARGGEVIFFLEWVKIQAEGRLPELRAKLKEKQSMYSALQEEVRQEAYQSVVDKAGGRIPREVFISALTTLSGDIWRQRGGNRLHFEVKTLEGKIAVLEGILQGCQEAEISLSAESEAEVS